MQPDNPKQSDSHSSVVGGGKMGDLIRSYNWNETSLGNIQNWSIVLKTTLNTVLNSCFPKLLYWGNDLITFYNDALSPSLGNNRHPWALGKTAEAIWPEAWEVIKPLMDKVLTTGKATYDENKLIPIHRNGKLEDVYWTFSYSPIYEEEKIAGLSVICIETTETVKASNKLQLSEQRFQNLVREASVGIIVLTGESMRVDVVNEVYGHLVGRTVAELSGQNLFDIIPEAEETFRPVLDKVRVTGEAVYLYDQYYSVNVNGAKKNGFLNLVYQQYKETNGPITGVMVLCQDVTEGVLARKKIEESEQRVRSVVESAPFPIGVYVGREMKIWLANQSILDVWGKGNDVIGKLYSEILPELDSQQIFEQLNGVFTTGIPFHAKNQRVDLMVDGKMKQYYFNYSFTPLYDALGQIYGVMNTAADVTDLALAKQKIEESERNFRNLVLQAPVGICIVKGDPLFVEVVNDSFLKLVGKQRSDFEQNPYWEVLKEAEDYYKPILEKVVKTGQMYIGKENELRLIRNGIFERIFLDFVYEPILETDGSVERVMILAIEITDQVMARRKIEESEALLQIRVDERTRELHLANLNLANTNKELEQFTYAASHDMQEPLRKVNTFSNFLIQNYSNQLEPNAKAYLNKISTSVNRMKTIINDLLNYSHQTREEQQFTQVNLNKTLENVQIDLEMMIEQKQAIITTQLLPEIHAVEAQMNQLFLNLLSNALKFSKQDIPVQVKISSEHACKDEVAKKGLPADRAYIKIIFSDNGIGFDQHHEESIFSLFKRLHTKREYEGTGIGLGLCKKIVQNHKGAIWAESQLGKGSSFYILLPEK